MQRVFAAYQKPSRVEPDTTRLIVSVANQARACFGEAHASKRIWLLNKEVWGLDELKRYREASRLTKHFFDNLYNDADSLYKARFGMHAVRFLSFEGDFEGAVEAHDAAVPYLKALSVERRLHTRLNAASLYHEAGQYRRAARMADEVLREGESAAGMEFVPTRARFARTEARMELLLKKGAEGGDDPEDTWRVIISNLEEVAAAYQALGMMDRYSVTLADLGEAYAQIDEEALSAARLAAAFSVARADENPKSEIFALFRRGRVHLKQQAFDRAERDFNGGLALADSSGIGKYTLDLLFELGRSYEERGRQRRARDAYRLVIDHPQADFIEGAIRMQALKHEAQARLSDVLTRLERRGRLLAYSGWLFALVVLSLLGFMAYKWRASVKGQSRGDEIIKPPGYVGERRHYYLKQIASDPRKAAALIKQFDPRLARRLARSKIRGAGEIYDLVGAVEFVVEGNLPTRDAVRVSLQRLYKDGDWPELDTLEAWRRHFEAHPME